jgi:uncharacterized protein
VTEFVNRADELASLERWWGSGERMPVSLYGRRRSGKSWLFRRFAHGKPGVLLVARRTAPGAQLADFAERLEPLLGVRPSLPDLPTLFRVLFRAARDQKLLVVIDEFPYLLPSSEAETDRELTAIAAVMEEEREESELKLILCGSLVSQMESLLAERGPLHGRLVPLRLQPLPFPEARRFLADLEPLEQFERYAVAGGMPRYLSDLGGAGELVDVLCERVLNPNTALWDEGRTILDQELREPKVYFAVLQLLAGGDKESNEIVQVLRSDAQRVSKYLKTLEDMKVVSRRLPVGSEPGSRGGHWHLRDPFFRFWFRFVFPYQDELETGLGCRELYEAEVAPGLSSHVAPEFEEFCRWWTRQNHGAKATAVGPWWGHALHEHRRAGTRFTEEIDVVGLSRNKVTLIGEARWRTAAMDLDYLRGIEQCKLPALRQSRLTVVERPLVLLFSRAGYTDALVAAAADRADVVLVDVPAALRSA